MNARDDDSGRDKLEEHARKLGLQRLFVEASITARPFFEAQGFVVVKPNTVCLRGVALTNFVREKNLIAT